MSESLEQSREAALTSFQGTIAAHRERRRAIDGTIVGIVDVHSLTNEDAAAWDMYHRFLRAAVQPKADYAKLFQQVNSIIPVWRERAKTAFDNKEASRSAYYAWMLNRLSPLVINLSAIGDSESQFDDIIADFKAEFTEYFGS